MFESLKRLDRDDVARRRSLSNDWQKSTFCTAGTCVETRFDAERVSIRDSKETANFSDAELQPMLHIGRSEFAVFLAELIGDASPESNGSLFVREQADGMFAVSSPESKVQLTYDGDEWQAFLDGVAAGEFGEPAKASS